MDLDEFRAILRNTEVDVWSFIETAIQVASLDFGDELRGRRDSIVAKLYASECPNCHASNVDDKRRETAKVGNHSPYTPVSVNGDDEENHHDEQERRRRCVDHDDDDGVGDVDGVHADDDDDDEQRRIISMKEQLEDLHQPEDSLLLLLQTLADMDITFKALRETDIGRHVNQLRKHSSAEVRRLVKLLVRKWKDLVDEWVRSNNSGDVQSSNNLIVDGDSPQQNLIKNKQNGHQNQVPDFGYSPNTYNGSSSSDRNNSELEPRTKKASASATPPPCRDPPARPTKSPSAPVSAPPPNRHKEVVIDPDRLASARKRLQENYQEAQNAKKQRTIQVMDIHEIPKPRNAFQRHKGGFHRH